MRPWSARDAGPRSCSRASQRRRGPPGCPRSIALGGFTCLVTGDVHCECLVGAPAASRECECACDAPPEGTLYVNGRLRADAIVGYASKIYAGEIACRALVDGTELRTWDTVVDASGEPRRQPGLVPSTCRASDVLEGSVLEDEAGRLPDRGLGSSPSLAARQVPRPRRSTPCASAMGSTD